MEASRPLYKLAHALLDAPGWSTSYREVTTKGYAGSTAGTRRTLIRAKARPLVEHELSSEDAETLRRYIDDVLEMPDIAATNQFAHVVCPNLSQYDVDETIKAPPTPTPTPTQEPYMAKSLTIENKTFLNNVDIDRPVTCRSSTDRRGGSAHRGAARRSRPSRSASSPKSRAAVKRCASWSSTSTPWVDLLVELRSTSTSRQGHQP